METQAFVDYIEQRAGIYLESKYELKLKNAIKQRMTTVKSDNEKAYLNLVRQSREEFSELINLVTVNETYFQREPRHFEILAEEIAPKLLERTSSFKPARIVSAGCSSGEEIYSAAMTLHGKFGDSIEKRFEFLAFDIDNQALEVAKKGVYGRSSFRSISPEFLKRYFEDFGVNSKRVLPELREQVRFIRNNIASPSYSEEFNGADVIFYRNTSIYFKPETQKKIFRKLVAILNDPGYLFLSATETFVHDFGALPLVELDNVFFFSSDPDLQRKNYLNIKKTVKTEKKSAHADFKRDIELPKPNLKEKKKPEFSEETFERICEMTKSGRYYDALKIIGEVEISDDSLGNNISIVRAKISIDLGQYDKAREICLEVTEKDQWLLWPYLLLGYLAMCKGDEAEQLERFKKAVYILPTCWLAHYGLLKYHILKSDYQNIRKKAQTTIRLLEKDASDWLNPGFAPKIIDKETILRECHGLLNRH